MLSLLWALLLMTSSWYIQALEQTLGIPFLFLFSYPKKVVLKCPTWVRKYLPFFKHIAFHWKSEGITFEANFKFVTGRHIIVCFPRIKCEQKYLWKYICHRLDSMEANDKRIWHARYWLGVMRNPYLWKEEKSRLEKRERSRRPTKLYSTPQEALEFTWHKSGLSGWALYLCCNQSWYLGHSGKIFLLSYTVFCSWRNPKGAGSWRLTSDSTPRS